MDFSSQDIRVTDEITPRYYSPFYFGEREFPTRRALIEAIAKECDNDYAYNRVVRVPGDGLGPDIW